MRVVSFGEVTGEELNLQKAGRAVLTSICRVTHPVVPQEVNLVRRHNLL